MRPALAALVLAACSASGPDPVTNGVIENATDTTLEQLPDDIKALPIGATAPIYIEGEWRVAGINGEEFDDRWTPTATIAGSTIRIQSQCIWMERRYRLDGMQFVPPATVADDKPQEMCARGWTPGEEAMEQALRGAALAYRLPDGALVLDGPEGSITLFTQ